MLNPAGGDDDTLRPSLRTTMRTPFDTPLGTPVGDDSPVTPPDETPTERLCSAKRFVLVIAGIASVCITLSATFVMVPKLREMPTWQLAALVSLCILPGLVALAMKADRAR